MSLAGLLIHRMDVLQENPLRQGAGSLKRDRWITRVSGVRCNVQPLASAQQIQLLHQSIQASHKVYFEHTATTIGNGDRMRIDGRQYEIQVVTFARQASWPSTAIVQEVLDDTENPA